MMTLRGREVDVCKKSQKSLVMNSVSKVESMDSGSLSSLFDKQLKARLAIVQQHRGSKIVVAVNHQEGSQVGEEQCRGEDYENDYGKLHGHLQHQAGLVRWCRLALSS